MTAAAVLVAVKTTEHDLAVPCPDWCRHPQGPSHGLRTPGGGLRRLHRSDSVTLAGHQVDAYQLDVLGPDGGLVERGPVHIGSDLGDVT